MVELGTALHALDDPTHHDAVDWARRVRALMSASLRRETSAWAWTTRAIRATAFVRTAGAAADIARLLPQLASDPGGLAAGLLRPITRAARPDSVRGWGRARGRDVADIVEALLDRPGQAVERFLSFVAETVDQWYADVWAERSRHLHAEVRRILDHGSTAGFPEALETRDAAIRSGPSAGSIVIDKMQRRSHDVSERGMVIVPSTFTRPHVYVGDLTAHPLVLIVPSGPGADRVPAKDVLQRLETTTSRPSLEVARAIATEPRTAGEIASLWGIDPTQVTRHLRSLAEAGLARPQRRGRYVAYFLDHDRIRALGNDLLDLLLR